jgi:hypothetical protein
MICLSPLIVVKSRLISRHSIFRIGEKMEALTNFFEAINKFLGVSTPGELLFHPVFVGTCIVLFIYALATGMRYFAVVMAGFMGGAAIIHYMYPENASDLAQLMKFVAAMGGLGLVLVYFGFLRE